MSKFAGLALEADRPFKVYLRKPDTNGVWTNGEQIKDAAGNPAYVEVISTDSRAFNAVRHDFADADAKVDKPFTVVEREARGAETLARLTRGWYLVGYDGKPIELPFSVDDARDMYADPTCTYIREQVSVAAGNRANFTPALQSA